MHLVTVRTENGTRAGRVEGSEIILLDHGDVRGVIEADGGIDSVAELDGDRIPLESASLAPVIPKPDKIICVGVNYADHIAEMGRTPPDAPTYFAKYARALVGPHDDLVLPDPAHTSHIDWECELAVIIGRPVRHASTSEEALAGVAGYAVLNDVSCRDWQRRTTQFLGGKTWEALTPLGPAMVTRDEIGDGSGLNISTTVDGVVKQESNTDHLIFNVVDIVKDLSRIMTLDPGDVIATGTPGGVGAARTPPEWLAPGRTMTTTVEGLGQLVNTCR
jgi:acylpyruvate hydrolase